MSDKESQELPVTTEAVSKPLGIGATAPDLKHTISRFAARLQRQHSEEITKDPKKFKCRVVAFLRQKLPPFPGRPNEATITKAIELRKDAQEWQQIYPQCIPNHSRLEPAVRMQAESNLRAAIRARRNAARRRKRQRRLIAESSKGSNVPLG